MKAAIQVIFRWLDERFDMSSIEAFVRHKTVPQHRHSVWYYFGGMTLFLFFVQIGRAHV